jgi:hypothetical protein
LCTHALQSPQSCLAACGGGARCEADVWRVVVGVAQVRSVGSWAGNLMLSAHNTAFPSDVALILMGLGVTCTVIQSGSTLTVPVEQVYARCEGAAEAPL